MAPNQFQASLYLTKMNNEIAMLKNENIKNRKAYLQLLVTISQHDSSLELLTTEEPTP